MLAELTRHLPKVGGAWVFRSVNAVTESRNLLVRLQPLGHIGFGAISLADFLQHLHHLLVCAAMQGTGEGADG